MNSKVKAVVMAAVVLSFIASAVYVTPTLAYQNGDIDQTRDRDMDRIRDRDCACDCDCNQDQSQICTHLQLQEGTSNQTNIGQATWQQQHQYEQWHRNRNLLSP